MNVISFLQLMLRLLIRLILAVLIRPFQFLKLLFDRFRETMQYRQRGGRQAPCLPVSREILRKPDPLIYSQSYFMSLGMSVTWDNRDIVLEHGGVAVDSHNLLPDTDYDIHIRVSNGSNEAPAIGVRVRAYFQNWGVGGTPVFIGDATIDVGVRGAPNEPEDAHIPWHTPATPGHYCITVELDHVDDLNPANNVGQENTDVRSASSNPGEEVIVEIPIRHQLPGKRTLHLETTGYALPEKPLYPPLPAGMQEHFKKSAVRIRQLGQRLPETAIRAGKRRGEVPLHNWTAYRVVEPARPGWPTGLKQYGEDWLPRIVEANSPLAHPAPEAWQPTLSRADVTLEPEEETSVQFRVIVPEDAQPGSRQRFQVNVLDDLTGLVGGVELIVEVT